MKTSFLPALFASALLTCAAISAAAQTAALAQIPVRPKPAAKPKAPTEPLSDEQIDQKAYVLTVNMQKNLGMQQQQFDRVRAINRRSVENVETARARYRDNPRKMLSIIDDISASRLSALKDVLTVAQFDKYQRKREEKMGLPNTQGVQGNPAPGFGGE